MNTIKSIALLLLIFVFGCMKNEDPISEYSQSQCFKNILSSLGMVEYRNQEFGCNIYLELYHNNGQNIYRIGSHCGFYLLNIIDCEGEGRSCYEDTKGCFPNATFVKIVGIEK